MPTNAAPWPQPLLALAFGVLLVAGWLNPTHYLPWSAFYSELPVAVGAVVLAVSAIWSQRGTSFRLPTSTWVCLAVSLLPVVQLSMGKLSFTGDLLLATSYLTGAAICTFIGANSQSGNDKSPLTDCIAWSILLAGVPSTAIALQQWFGQADWSEWVVQGLPGARADSNLRQANHFATLLMWGMLAAAHLRARGKLSGFTLGVVAAFLALGLALSQSKTVWVASLMLGAWAVARRRELWEPLAIRGRSAAALVALYSLLLWGVFSLPPHLGLEWAVEAEERLQVGGRPLIWAQMIEAIRLSPWTGYGWLQGQSAQAAAAIAKPGMEFTTYAHNLALDLMIWNGIPIGALLGIMLLVWYLRLGLAAEGAADAFRFAVLTVFAVHSLLEYPFAYTYFLVPVLLLAGQLETRVTPARAPGLPASVGRAVAASFALLCGAATWAIARDYVLLEADRREVQMVLARVGGDRPFPSPPEVWVLDQLGVAGRAARIVVRKDMPEPELQTMLSAARRYPGVYLLRMSSAALALNGREGEAWTQLKTLRGLHGDAHYRASVAWLEEQAASQGWSIGRLLQSTKAPH